MPSEVSALLWAVGAWFVAFVVPSVVSEVRETRQRARLTAQRERDNNPDYRAALAELDKEFPT